jgi:hypothetical protein
MNPNQENRYVNVTHRKFKSGSRTYFFDVLETQSGDYYLTITESRRRYNPDKNTARYQRQKIYLYKENFKAFANCLNELMTFVIDKKGEEIIHKDDKYTEEKSDLEDVFDDLTSE